MLYKSCKASYKAGEEGVVEAYVSVFGNVDSYGDRVKYGAFTESLATKAPKLVWQHDLQRPIGKTLEAREIPAGDPSLPDDLKDYGALWVKGAFNLNTTDGRDAYEHIKFGSVDEYSFGYEEIESAPNQDGTKDLTKLRFVEWSPVTLGANPLTATASVKAVNLDTKTDAVAAALDDVMDYVRKHKDMKEKAGAAISRVRRERLRGLAEAARAFYKELDSILSETEPQPREDAKGQLAVLRAKFHSLDIN